MTLSWITEAGLQTLQSGYLLPGEEPEDLYERVAKASATALKNIDLANYFYEAMERNWLCLASPVAANLGTDRGLPISCFGISVPDSVDGIFSTAHELAMLSKNGGGVGINLNPVRGRGSPIRGNGYSEGVVPWAKVYDSSVLSVNQGSTRRGAASVNLSVDHPDIHEYLKIRRASGDVNRQCLNLHQCVQVTDDFMRRVKTGDTEARELWREILKSRIETGEPYIMFVDTVNKANPDGYVKNNLNVSMTNICSEITLYTDDEHSFVCCLSSLNLSRYDEWKDYHFDNGMSLPELSIWFLDGVLQEFINRSDGIPGYERSRRSAIKGRALGLGVLGWHSYLQSRNLPFDTSVEVMGLNHRIFKFIREEAEKGSRELAKEYGEPEWNKGTGMRNSHLMALAPTVSNSLISGGLSATIEPITANAYTNKTAKGTFTYKNPYLESVLEEIGENTPSTWRSIVSEEGSVQHLTFLSQEQKDVFLTAREINQLSIIRQAAARQPFIDQAQSLNLFFPVNVDAKWFHKVHMEAWESGLKTLYYCRSSSVLKADVASRYYDESCTACEG